MTKFDTAIQDILMEFDLSNQGKGGLTQTGGNISSQQSATPAKNNSVLKGNDPRGIAVTAPDKTFVNKNTMGPRSTETPLFDRDGKTPIIDPKTQQPITFDRDLAQKNPQQFTKDFSERIKGFSPEQQQYLMNTVFTPPQQ
jgi:hypothetical protein